MVIKPLQGSSAAKAFWVRKNDLGLNDMIQRSSRDGYVIAEEDLLAVPRATCAVRYERRAEAQGEKRRAFRAVALRPRYRQQYPRGG